MRVIRHQAFLLAGVSCWLVLLGIIDGIPWPWALLAVAVLTAAMMSVLNRPSLVLVIMQPHVEVVQ